MISFLSGKISRSLPHGVILDVSGVGYELHLPLPVILQSKKLNEHCEFWIYTKVKEDSITLFGFASWEARQTFAVLIQISGVGPKVALAIMSALDIQDLKNSVLNNEPECLYSVPGIGKRTAEKIIMELKVKIDRIPDFRTDSASNVRLQNKGLGLDSQDLDPRKSEWGTLKVDLYSALENLGFKDKDIKSAVKMLSERYEIGQDLSDLIKQALTLIRNNAHVRKNKIPRKEMDQELANIF